MKIFISYSSKDRPLIVVLADELADVMGYEVWFDRELNRRGGHKWWADILQAIRDCDVFLYAASPNLIHSKACDSEYAYAVALGKPVLPVKVVEVPVRELPREIRNTQICDARNLQSIEQRKLLRFSINSLPASPPLPPNAKELEPPVPPDPVADLLDAIKSLSAATKPDEQLFLIVKIEEMYNDHHTDQRFVDDVLELAERLIDRDDVLTGRNLNRAKALLARVQAGPVEQGYQIDPPPVQPPPRVVVPVEPTIGTIRRDAKGIEQVYVPAGQFMMGSDLARDKDTQGDEQPAHLVRITRALWLDRFPVTNAAYKAFMDDGGYANRALWTPDGWAWRNKDAANGAPANQDGFGEPNQPRIGVCWYEANAYAKWRGGRLPTEAEWEYAARGEKASIYPWGDDYDPSRLNAEQRIGKTTPVDQYPNGMSWCGAYDLSGNVWEWAADWFDSSYYQKKVQDDPLGPASGSSRALRGGSWFNLPIFARAVYRLYHDPDLRLNVIGFRVVAAVGGAPVV